MIAIIDYKAGNLTSMRLAFESLGARAEITDDPAVVLDSERVVFPGVGAAGAAMRRLTESGLADAILTVAGRGAPFLGVCLGAQIILDRTEEDGGVSCLGLVAGSVRLFRPADARVKVPHMGWNQVRQIPQAQLNGKAHPILQGIEDCAEFYFVHSYYPVPAHPHCVLGETNYAGAVFASVFGRGNIVATQFHPEKSGRIGLKLLENFLRWPGSGRRGG